MQKTVTTLAEFEAEAERFARSIIPSEGKAKLVTLSGELGAGKTTFTKAVAKELGVEGIVTSPTFVLEKIYLLPRKRGGSTATFARLIHIDAYRLDSGADLIPLGFDEFIGEEKNLILLEWPERVRDALPSPSVHISFTTLPDNSRTILYE